ncbi:hypothetical protein TNCV_4030651 [Trichonephila clavipes]|nr:hypothetical protein TNCV_4030651 [Trichonephila clavipes]
MKRGEACCTAQRDITFCTHVAGPLFISLSATYPTSSLFWKPSFVYDFPHWYETIYHGKVNKNIKDTMLPSYRSSYLASFFSSIEEINPSYDIVIDSDIFSARNIRLLVDELNLPQYETIYHGKVNKNIKDTMLPSYRSSYLASFFSSIEEINPSYDIVIDSDIFSASWKRVAIDSGLKEPKGPVKEKTREPVTLEVKPKSDDTQLHHNTFASYSWL